MSKKYIVRSVLLCIAIGCAGVEEQNAQNPQGSVVTLKYQESDEDFPNPERGFYEYSETYASGYEKLSEATLKSYRNPKNGSGATYQTVSTLVFRYYVLDSFKTGPLSENFLAMVSEDYAIARKAGVKIIPRFTYTLDAKPGSCPEGFICPPYGDAAKEIVLQHIEQLKPVLQQNVDVIACVQLGFIGVWGENYYTDYFGDASPSGQSKLLDSNWNDRNEILSAMLKAVPAELMIQVRYPQIKQRYIYGVNAGTSSSALVESESFTESEKARIGFHNDCFLASADDYGTYEDYGNSSSPKKGALTTLRSYFSADSKFVVVGGETCDDNYNPQSDCEPTGHAQKEFADMHYSYLNSDYNSSVNNDWNTGGCIDNIKKRLGYRFVIREAEFPRVVDTGGELKLKIDGENIGYASPFNARPALLILRSKENGMVHKFPIDTDLRKWFSGPFKIEQTIKVPENLKAGEYEILLSLPDKHVAIADRFEYSIRLANTGLWEQTTGFNNLNHVVTIK
jgi:hypothetical protein